MYNKENNKFDFGLVKKGFIEEYRKYIVILNTILTIVFSINAVSYGAYSLIFIFIILVILMFDFIYVVLHKRVFESILLLLLILWILFYIPIKV